MICLPEIYTESQTEPHHVFSPTFVPHLRYVISLIFQWAYSSMFFKMTGIFNYQIFYLN